MLASAWLRRLFVVVLLMPAGAALAQSADLSVTLSDTPDPITLGTGSITYTANVFNGGTSSATNATLTFNAPSSSTVDSSTANLGGTCSAVGQTVTCSWTGITSGNNRSVSIVVTPTAGGTLTASASVTAIETDPNSSNNNASTTTTVNASIDLRILTMTDTPDPITLGTGNITYSTTIYNASSSKATNPVLTLTLPGSWTFVSATPNLSGTCNGPSGGILTCSWAGDLASGSTRSVSLIVTPTAGGTLTLTGAVDGDQPDDVPSNDTATQATTVNANIDLRLFSMSDTPDPITLGTGDITYSVTIYNAATSKATNPLLTLTLPSASTFVSASANVSGTCSGAVSGVVTCNWAGDFISGATRTVTLLVTPTAGGTATLGATVDADQPDDVPANDSATHTTTVNEFIDLRIFSISDTPDPITLGTGNITYSVTIYNAATSKATNPVLTLTLPSASTFVSASANVSGTCSGAVSGVVTCNWAGDFTSGATRTVTLVVTPTAGGTATLGAAVDGDQPDNVTSNDTATHSTTVNEFIDLRIFSISDTPDPITLGTGNITYSVTIYNAATSKATNPVLTLTLPSASTFVSATANVSGTCSGPSSGVVTCNWAGDFTSGATRTVTLVVTPTAGGTATLGAAVDGDQPDNVTSNDTATHTTTVNEFIDLRIFSISDTPDPITLGTGNITYSVTIYNAATSKATNPVLTLTLPSASSFVSATANVSGTCSGAVSGVVTCSWAGDFTSGATRTVTLVVTPTAGGTATLGAAVDGDQPDDVPANDTATHTTTVNEFIDLRVFSINDTPDPITLGTGNITYSVTIYNAATSKATNPVLTLTLPSASTFVSATANNSGTCSGAVSGVVTCSWAGDFTSGATRTVTLVVTPTAGGTATLGAAVDGDQPDDVPANDSATHTTTVNEFIDLRILSMSDTPDPITLGTGNITYSVTIYNAATSKATNPVLTLTLPSSSTFVSATANISGTCSGAVSGVVTCTWAGDLTSGATRTATLVVTPTAGGTLTLGAAVDGDQPDDVPANDTATHTTTVNSSIELSLSISDSPDPRVIGAGNVTYSISAFNSSTSKATNPIITFAVPSTTTWVSSTPSTGGTCSLSGSVVTCSWTDISASSTRTVSVVVTPSQVGQLSASGNVNADQPDPNSTNNSVTVTTNINPNGPPLVSGFTPTSGPAGTSVTITGTNFFSSTSVKFNGFSSTFTVVNNTTITATVPNGATTGVISVTNGSGTSSSGSSFTVTPAPDLSISKTASAASTPTSSAYSYTLTVSNIGAGAAADATVTDTLPAGVTLTSASGGGWTCTGTSTVTCTYSGGIAASTSALPITLNVTAPSSGTTVVNTATVSTTTPDSNAANNSSSVSVGVVGCPTTPAITAPASVCASSTGHTATTPSVPGATYAWSITNGTITSGTNASTITFDASSTDPVTLNVSVFVTSCPTVSNSATVNISTPAATITASGPTTFCAGGSVTLTANAGTSYLWSTNETTQSITVSTPGSYTVAVTNAAGCTTTSAPANVAVNSLPSATITPSGPTTFCNGGSVTLTAPAGMSAYLWSTNETTPSITVTQSGSYFVTVTGTNGCSNTSAPTSVTVQPAPTATITASGSTTFCAGGSVTLTASAGASYLWSNSATTQSITVNASGNYSVTVTDGTGCSATSAPTTVTVNPLPTPVITGPANACGSAMLDAGANYVSYAWSHGPTTQTVNVTSSGTYSVTVTDANGCSATTSHTINITAPPPVTIQGPSTVCSTDVPVTLDAGSGYVSYAWAHGPTSQIVNVTTSGTYSVTVIDANGCSATGTHTLTVNPAPSATITASGATTFCDGGSVTLTSNAAQSYAWSNGATTQSITVNASGTFTVTTTNSGCSTTSAPMTVTVHPPANVIISGPASACGNATLDAGPGFASYNWSTGETTRTINVNASGNYVVNVVDANGCAATDTHSISITAIPSNAVTASGPTTFCSGGSVTLTAASASSYLWSTGENTQSIVVASSGNYSVTASNGTCSATSAPINVTVHPAANVTITGPSTACGNAALDAGPGYASYNWSTGENTRTINVSASGNYSVTVTDTNGCSATDGHSITVTPTLSATITASGPTTFCSGGSVTLTASAASSYAWTNGATTQSITVTSSGTYKVTTSNGACNATASGVIVTVNPAPIAAIAAPSSADANDTGLTATVSAQPGATYAWGIANGTITSGAATNAITFTAGSSGTTTVTAIVTLGSCSDTDTHAIAITAPTIEEADLALTKLAPSSVTAGATFTYTLVATNHGPSNTPSAVVTDTLPSGLTVVSVTGGALQCSTPQSGIICSGALAAGATSTITLTVTASQSGTITNTATIDGGLADPQPGNNSASATTVVHPISSDPCANRIAATLVAPSNNATLAASSVDLQWTASPGAIGYRVWARIDEAPEAVLGTTSETSLRVVISRGAVEWWIESLYEGCASVDSLHARFVIPARNDCSSAAPQATSPSNVTLTNALVTFQWSGVPNAASYEVWLAVDNGTPTRIGTTSQTSLTESVPPGVLDWFVRAIVSGCPSVDSQTLRFTYTPPPNCASAQRATLVAPLPDAHVTSPADFGWTAVEGASAYQLIAMRGNAEEVLASTAATSVNDVALTNGNLRWFVRAQFSNGCSPLDSAEQQLVVVPLPAACATLTAPRTAMVSQISSAMPIVVQWNEVPGATSYELQLASDASFANAETITTSKTIHTLTRINDGNAPIAVHARARAVEARCTPANATPFGPSAVVFILPVTGNEISAPLSGGVISQQLHLDAALAGQSFAASTNQPWLAVSPASGVIAANGTTLTVTANTTGLPLGTSLGAVYVDLTSSARNVRANGTTRTTSTISVGKATPILPAPKSAPPPDALIIPAVAHADGINSKFQSDVRVTNSSAQLMNYQVTFTPTGEAGIANGKQTQFSIDPGRTIALDDVLKSWFGTGGASVTGTLEVRPLTQTATSTSSNGLANLVTFASSRTFNVTSNGTFGQYIPAIPFANFIGKSSDVAKNATLSLQQIAQSDRYRTNLGIVEGSGEPASLLVRVFSNSGQKLTEFPVNLAGGQHTQLNSFITAQGIGPVTDGRIEVSVVGGAGKVTAYASVLDNETSDPLLVTPVTLGENGANRWVVPGVADLDNGTANWQTDLRVFNAGSSDVETTLTFYSQNGGTPRTANVTIPAGQVKQFDRTLSNVFGATNDGGAVHIRTSNSARLIATARTYNQTSKGTYGQFISAVTTSEAAGVGSRPLQLLQVEESDRFRSNIGLAEVTGNAVKLEVSIVPPDAKFTAVTEVTLQPNEFRQLNSLLRSAGLGETYNARVTVRAIEGNGRVTAYASVIDMQTNDPTYVPAQ